MLKICGVTLLCNRHVRRSGAGTGGVAHPQKHFAACADGMVKAACMCGAKGHSKLCKAGQWCHGFESACRQ
jgi:hypothetical protein